MYFINLREYRNCVATESCSITNDVAASRFSLVKQHPTPCPELAGCQAGTFAKDLLLPYMMVYKFALVEIIHNVLPIFS
jgi:hypothetical protein